MDQIDKDFVADLAVILVILLFAVVGFAVLNVPSILLGGGLALTVAVIAEYVWSRGSKPASPH